MGKPIKKPDAEPLWRKDIQWDLLTHLFSNSTYRFTPPNYPSSISPLFPTDRTWSFAELYLDCTANSTKATRNLKDKMAESQDFAVNFAKICLLVNVGRINTTIAFFPEMRTAMRTYHPVPSMQMHEYTRKNLQDAPRLKSQLKAALLPQELKDAPETLSGIAYAAATGKRPSTSVVNLIFTMFGETGLVTNRFMPEGYETMDLFWPNDIPAPEKANAFLWLIHRFLEHPDILTDLQSTEKIPVPFTLTRGDTSQENADPQHEVDFGREAQKKRQDFTNEIKKSAGAAAEDALNTSGTPGTSRRAGLRTHQTEDQAEDSPAVSVAPENKPATIAAHAYLDLLSTSIATRKDEEAYWDQHMRQRQRSLNNGLHHTWERTKADLAELRDVMYESDEEPDRLDWDQAELRQRMNVFQFRDERGQQIVRFGLPVKRPHEDSAKAESPAPESLATREPSRAPSVPVAAGKPYPPLPSVLSQIQALG